MATNPEALLISSVLREKDFTTAMARGVTNELFHAYQDEWLWIERYFSKHRKTPSKLAFKNHFPEFQVKAVEDTAHFVDEVRKSHSMYAMTGAMRDAADLMADGDVNAASMLLQKSVVTVNSQIGGTNDVNILESWKGIYDDVKFRKDKFDSDGMAGVPTGFETLDERTGGLQPGQLWIVGARLGEGKSWAMLRMAVAAIIMGHKVHFAALEMSQVDVAMRIHNFLSGSVGKQVFQSMALSQGKNFDIKAYREFLRTLSQQIKGTMTVSDKRKIGSLEIAAQIERHRPDVYFLDYLTLAKTQGDGGWQDIGRLAKDLKDIAGEYKIPIVSAAQLNRADGTGKAMPGPEALAQADAIGQDADAVITMKKRSDTIIEFMLAKYRHGNAGYGWHAKMDLDRGEFNELSYNKAMDQIEKDKEAALSEKENSR